MKIKFDFSEKLNMDITYYIIYSFITFLILGSILQFGYFLTVDWTFAPRIDISKDFYGLRGYSTFIYAELPFLILIKTLSIILPSWFIQKLMIFSMILLSGISAYSLIPTKSKFPKFFAGLIYMINPFIYVRFLSGQWANLFAYALIPFALIALIDLIKNQNKKNIIKFLIVLSLVNLFSIHYLILTLLICMVFLTVILFKKEPYLHYKKRIAMLSFLIIIYILINFYWIFPVLSTGNTVLTNINQDDLYTFATTTSAFNAAFTIASMYGFWRWGYIYAKDFIPYWYLLFVFILFLAVHGFISNYKSKTLSLPVKAFAVVAVIAVILGSGIYGPFSSLFEYLFNNVFFFRGLRDSHKFAALLALSYSYLGALGVAEFEKIARSPGAYKKLAWAVVIIALVTPFIYSFTMFNGFWGQLKPTDYPGDWYETNDLLNNDTQDFNVLFLPWHQYMDFTWIPNSQKRIANPASNFFDKPVIQGENTEVGSIYSQSTNPAQRYVEALLRNRSNLTNFGELMIPLNIKYVLLTKEVDYKEYFFLFNQTDIELIKETDNFYVFKNKRAVSRFYISPDIKPEFSALKPLEYTQTSPVKFSVNADAGYIMFVPPNLDSEYWVLENKPSSVQDFYAVYPAGDGAIYYKRFDTYLSGYFLSLITLLGLFAWYRKISER